MEILQSKKLFLTMCVVGCILIFLGIVFRPSFVANHLSSHGILEESTVKGLQNLRIITICLGILAIFFGILVARCPMILPGVSGLLDSKLIVPVLLLISLCYLLSGNRIGLNIYDEGLSVYGATRILNGDIPYRDFWTIYAPGQFYALALLFKVFGPSIMAERVYSGIVHFLIVVFTYCLAKKLVSQKFALLSWFLITVRSGSFGFYASPMPPAIMFSLLSCLCLAEFICKKQKWGLLIAGISTGLAALFRHDIGFYTFLSGTAVVIPFVYMNLSKSENNRMRKVFESLQTWSRYLAGTAVVMLPVAVFFIYSVPIQDLFSDLILFPGITFPKFRSMPYPAPIPNPMHIINGEQTIFSYAIAGLDRVPFYFPLIVFAITLLGITFSIRNRRNLSEKKWLTILFFLLGVTFFSQARVRPGTAHLFPTIIPGIILFPSLLSSLIRKDNVKSHYILCTFLYFLAFLVILSLSFKSLGSIAWNFLTSPSTTSLVSLDLKRGTGIYVQSDQAGYLQQSIKYIQRYVPEEEKIFVGNSRHDRIFVNDIMFYFLAERHSATKYHELHPGLATTRHIQREIIDELNRHGIRYVVLWNGAENVREPNKSGESSGVTELDEFIRDNYRGVANFGSYTILKKIGQS
jgi:hypothetical protein